MTLSELRYLVAVADVKHFGHAAERCHVTQSTLSTQLRKLEGYLGVTLFERARQPVTTTPIGARIVERARRILEEADGIRDVARQDNGLLAGTLRLGTIPTLGPYLLPLFLDPLHRSYPLLRFSLREDLTDKLIEALSAHEVDVLLLALSRQPSGFAILPLFDEPFWVAFPAGDRLVEKPSLCRTDLAGRRLLLLAEGHCLREQALSVCGEHRGRSDAASEVLQASSLETICTMVAAGLGCTLLPALAIPRVAAAGSGVEVRPFRSAKAFRRIGLLWRSAFPRHHDLVAMGRFILDRLPPCVRPIGTPNFLPMAEPRPVPTREEPALR